MKKIFAWTLLMMFIVSFMISACGGKKEINDDGSMDKVAETIEKKKEPGIDLSDYKDLYIQIINAKTTSEYEKTESVNNVDTVVFGKYEIDGNLENGLEDIEWVVVAKNEKSAILMSKNILDCKSFLDLSYFSYKNIKEFKDVYNGNDYNKVSNEYGVDKITEKFKDHYGESQYFSWDKSSLREWLNDDFYNTAFNKKQKQYIMQYDISDGNTELKNKFDNCFCLSLEEMKKYFNFDGSGINTISYTCPTNFAKLNANYHRGIEVREEEQYKGLSDYWFRTTLEQGYVFTSLPQLNHDYMPSMFGYNFGGSQIVNYVNPQEKNIGVRPAICINLDMSEIENYFKKHSKEKFNEYDKKKSIAFDERMFEKLESESNNPSTSVFGDDNNAFYRKQINKRNSPSYYDPFSTYDPFGFMDKYFGGW